MKRQQAASFHRLAPQRREPEPWRRSASGHAPFAIALANSPRSTAQRQLIQAAFGAAAPVVQRIIKTPTTTVRAQDVLGTDPPGLSAAMGSAATYLMQSNADLAHVRRGDPGAVPVLAPAKHLIGEQHNASSFDQAVAAWGFGAAKMMEALSTNARMPHVAGDSARARVGSPYQGALPLEDTIAKDLTLAIKSFRFMSQCAQIAGGTEDGFRLVARALPTARAPLVGTDATTNALRQSINVLGSVARQMHGATDVSNIIADMRAYADAAPGAIRQFFGAAAWPQAAAIATTLDNAALMGRIATARDGLDAQAGVDNVWHVTQAQLAAGAGTIDQLITHLRTLLAASDPAADAAHDVAGSVANAKANGVADMNPIRERYMAASITNTLTVPGLVKIGAEHVDRVAAAVPGAVGHANYQDFVAASTSANAL